MNVSGIVKHTPKLFKALSKNMDLVCLGGGICGFIGAIIKAVQVTYDSVDDINDMTDSELPDDTRKAAAINLAKSYAPVAVACGISAFLVFKGYKISIKRQAELYSLLALSQSNNRRLKEAIAENTTKSSANKIETQANQKMLDDLPPINLDVIPHGRGGNTLIYDASIGRFFYSGITAIRQYEAQAAKDLLIEGDLYLNDWYDYLDVPHVELGDVLGFDAEHGLEVSVTSGIVQNIIGESAPETPCLVISYPELRVVTPF